MFARPEPPLIRLAALVMALGVLVLALASVSPALHARLHGAEAGAVAGDGDAPVGDGDHVCAVTLFAHGLTALLAFCLLVLGQLRRRSTGLRPADEVPAEWPRFRLVPAQAPPAA